MFYWIYDISNLLLAVLMCMVCVSFTWSGLLIFRPWIRKWLGPEPGENEFISYFLSAYGVFYGLMLGLIAVATYQNYSDVEVSVGAEAASLAVLYQDVSSYPEPERSNYQKHIRGYVRYVINEAWPAFQQGATSSAGGIRIEHFQQDLFSFQPKTKAEEIVHSETLRQFNAFSEARTARQQSVATALPEVLWYVVVIGAVLNFVLLWMFSIDRLSVHLCLTGILSLFVALMLFFIAAMDNPLRGTVSISPDPYRDVLTRLMTPVDATSAQ